MSLNVELACGDICACGEGPLWDDRIGKLCWLDISHNTVLNLYDSISRTNTKEILPTRVSCIVPYGEKDYAAATPHGISILKKSASGWEIDELITVDDNPKTVSNDGRCDSFGRFVLGFMHNEYTEKIGSFYLCDKDDKVCFQKDMIIPNGVAWSKCEERLFVVASRTNRIWEYEYDILTGKIGKGRVLIEIDDPDGMCADENGNLWVAQCGHGKVSCVDVTSKKVIDEILFPVKTVTSCVFGGESLDTLYVTSASWNREDILSECPLAGSMFKIDNMYVKGIKAHSFKY